MAEEYMRETIDGMLKRTSPNEVKLPNKVRDIFKACKD
jgi:hypothetical protein